MQNPTTDLTRMLHKNILEGYELLIFSTVNIQHLFECTEQKYFYGIPERKFTVEIKEKIFRIYL